MANGDNTAQAGVPPAIDSGQTGRELNRNARMWAMFCHLASFAGISVLPIFGFAVGPLIVWLIKKDDFPFVDEQGKEAVNFQMTMLILFLALPLTCVGVILWPAVPVVDFILVVIGAIKANDGYHYHYPFRIRFIK